MRHAALPFQQIVHELLPKRVHDPSRNAIFQAMLTVDEAASVPAAAQTLGSAVEMQPAASAGDSAGVAKDPRRHRA